MQINLNNIDHIFFVGVAGVGMSAIAQYLAGVGKQVSGSDRSFADPHNHTRTQLQAAGIGCFEQNGTGITPATQLIVVSTAIENTNAELQKASRLNIKVVRRAELLAAICATRRTIAVAGTSGKSTTAAMLFEILSTAGLQPSFISGAGLVRLQAQGLIGNAHVGSGEWLVIEADESDGSIVHYKPEVALLMNIDKDHKEIGELLDIFDIFKSNTQKIFVANAAHPLTAPFLQNVAHCAAHGYYFCDNEVMDNENTVDYQAKNFVQRGFDAHFDINDQHFELKNNVGKHNADNALAACTVANLLGVDMHTCAAALQNYTGIYRRNQVLGCKNGVYIIDDYAHNPAKIRAAIAGWQPLCSRVWAWFQPHGYGPTRFLHHDFVHEIAAVMRPADHIIFSDIYDAGGTADRNISANDIILDLNKRGVNAHYVPNRNNLVDFLSSKIKPTDVVLLMGARDPSLDAFATDFFEKI